MNEGTDSEYLTLDQACAYLGVAPAYLRRLLREHGLGEFLRASMKRQVLLRRTDLDRLASSRRPGPKRRGVA